MYTTLGFREKFVAALGIIGSVKAVIIRMMYDLLNSMSDWKILKSVS